MLPKLCQMPDLSHLDSLIPKLMTAVVGFHGEMLTERERLYVRVFVRLAEKAITEYKKARECVIAQVEDIKRQGGTLYFLGITDHLENCIDATRRLFWIFEKVKREPCGFLMKGKERPLRKSIDAHFEDIKNIRGAVIHIESKIKKDERGPIMLMISEDDESVKITKYSLRFDDLARLLKKFHKMARQWLKDFCRKPEPNQP